MWSLNQFLIMLIFFYEKVYTKDVIEKIVFSSFNYTYIIIGLALWASPIRF